MTVSIHDNKLISYTVNEEKSEILFKTIFQDSAPSEYTNVTFSNVAAYYFENHSLSLGTIIFDMEETEANSIMEANWNKIEEGKKYGWPGGWASTKDNASAYFKENNIKGYYINSSCGLCGWVLAENMKFEKIPNT